ncbi:restriction endonuclease subunit S [Acinetobacter baumannii]|uniref:restriction endonuclease subunit S n=1 Tax=Acinetobacter baumannii TaxID=470 RepID=UPI003A842F7B
MQFKQYPSYKNSGVEWLGDVPEHWQIVRTKDIFNHRKEEALEDDEIVTAFRDGQVTLRKNRRTDGFTNSIKEHGYQHINNGDLVIHEMDAFAGAIGVSDSSGKSTPVYTVCYAKNENINHHFYSHFFRTMAKTGFINSLAKGIRVRSTEFRWNESRNVYLAEPPKADQEKIVSFLDTETARIDNLIAKQEKLIELLEEQRKSIISHAVTKGLNPNVPMKDSGVEWLGDVPEHWEIYPIGYSFDLLKNNNVGDDWEHTQLLSLTLQGVIKKDINEAKGKTHSDYSTYQKVNVGDFIFCLFDIEETPRTVGVVETSGMITSAYTALKPKPFINPKYFYYFFECRDDLKAFGSEYSGLRKTIRPTKFIKLKICYPKLNEQCEIVGFLDTKCKKIDLLISKQQQLIKKLKEYRISIISHAVTGKIDVREFGA